MKEVTLTDLKKHLTSFNSVFSVKYVDNVRYYFTGKKVVAKIQNNSFYISEHIKKQK